MRETDEDDREEEEDEGEEEEEGEVEEENSSLDKLFFLDHSCKF